MSIAIENAVELPACGIELALADQHARQNQIGPRPARPRRPACLGQRPGSIEVAFGEHEFGFQEQHPTV